MIMEIIASAQVKEDDEEYEIVADAFDEPLNADLVIDTDMLSLAQSYTALRNLAENALEASGDAQAVNFMPPSMPGANIFMSALQ